MTTNVKLKFNKKQRKMLSVSQAYMSIMFEERKWFVAGGFMRDVALGRPIKDVDIFVNGFATDALPDKSTDLGALNAYIMYTKTVVLPSGVELNLIFLRGNHWNLKNVADRCDIGICQTSLDLQTGEQYFSDNFKEEFEKKHIVVRRSTREEHVTRVSNKLGFPWSNPHNYDLNASPNSTGFVYVNGTMVPKQTQLS